MEEARLKCVAPKKTRSTPAKDPNADNLHVSDTQCSDRGCGAPMFHSDNAEENH